LERGAAVTWDQGHRGPSPDVEQTGIRSADVLAPLPKFARDHSQYRDSAIGAVSEAQIIAIILAWETNGRPR
jgi:hypothetical protein